MYRLKEFRYFLVAFLVFSGLSMPCWAGEWYRITEDTSGDAFFLDKASIKSEGNLVRYAWMPTRRVAKKIAQGTGCPVTSKVKGAIIYNASDCSANKIYKGINSKFYTAKGELVWSKSSDVYQMDGQTPKPHSVFGMMHHTVCQLTQQQPSVSQRPAI